MDIAKKRFKNKKIGNRTIGKFERRDMESRAEGIILSFCIVLAGNWDINYRACSSVNGKTVSIIMKCLFGIVWIFFFFDLCGFTLFHSISIFRF